MVVITTEKRRKRVCVVGAGISGLCSLKNLLAAGMSACVLERTSTFGGTWVYTDEVGCDEHGLPVHSSMYKELRTNLPKYAMTLPGLEFDAKKKSFLPAQDVLDYIREYVRKFDLQKYLKFHHVVENIKPRGDGGWSVIYKNLNSGEAHAEIFDAVMVCVGHYSVPFYPKIKGVERFKGEVMHSHDYKSPERFAGKTVLVQGGGPSGLDLSVALSRVCKRVYLSHHLKELQRIEYLENCEHKPDVEEFVGQRSVRFVDGAEHEIDTALFCTGYVYSFPFLDASCGVRVDADGRRVQPLYRHLVNVEHPTMCIVGVPFNACVIPMSDLQARYFVESLKDAGGFALPTRDEMRARTEAYYRDVQQRSGGVPTEPRHAHSLAGRQQEYYDTLAAEANIEGVPPVYTKMHQHTDALLFKDIIEMRKHTFIMLDKDNYDIIPNAE